MSRVLFLNMSETAAVDYCKGKQVGVSAIEKLSFSAPSLLMHTSRTPPDDNFSIADTPTCLPLQ